MGGVATPADAALMMQLGSFYTEEEVTGVGKIPMAFIRAPFVESAGADTEIMARVDGNIVGVKHYTRLEFLFIRKLQNVRNFMNIF